MIQVVVEARQHQNSSERGSRFMLGSQRSHCHNKTNSGFVDYRAGILDRHKDRQIRRFTVSEAQSQRVIDLTKKGEKWEQGM